MCKLKTICFIAVQLSVSQKPRKEVKQTILEIKKEILQAFQQRRTRIHYAMNEAYNCLYITTAILAILSVFGYMILDLEIQISPEVQNLLNEILSFVDTRMGILKRDVGGLKRLTELIKKA